VVFFVVLAVLVMAATIWVTVRLARIERFERRQVETLNEFLDLVYRDR
jgi:hypothetical protein